MKQHDYIQQQLQKKIDLYQGPVTPEVLQKLIDEIVLEMNSRSIADSEGLSPFQLQNLLYALFGEKSLVRLNQNLSDEAALQSPLLKLLIDFLQIIRREELLKLTKTGALPLKIIAELYSKRHIVEKVWTSEIKVRTENDSVSIQTIKILSKLAGLSKTLHGELSLTAKGAKLIDSPAKLLILMVDTFFLKLNWGYFDTYDSQNAAQFGAGYTLFLLHKYGNQEHEFNFYADNFRKAFPAVIDEFEGNHISSSIDRFRHCYGWRTFGHGLNWLGLVDTFQTGKFMDRTHKESVKTTELFRALVHL
jgi:hypothetical protein